MKVPRVRRILVGAVLVVVALAIGAIMLAIGTNPKPLDLTKTHPLTSAPTPPANDPLAGACRAPALPATIAAGVSGLWVTQPESVAGYRAHEKFARIPSPHEAVGRTNRVRGWLLVSGDQAAPRIENGCIAVDLATLVSVDQLPGLNTSDRDEVALNFLHVTEHPYAIFQPYPSPINAAISQGAPVAVEISGTLELNGVSRNATFAVKVRYVDNQVVGAGNTSVTVEEFDIQVPQGANGFVSVDSHITLEVSLVLMKA